MDNDKLSQAIKNVAEAFDSLRHSIPEETLRKFSYTDPIEAPLTRDEAFKNVCKKNRRFK